jgi:hypothetical protein
MEASVSFPAASASTSASAAAAAAAPSVPEITEEEQWLRRDEYPVLERFPVQKRALDHSKAKGTLPVFARDKPNAANVGAKSYLSGSYDMMFMNMLNANSRGLPCLEYEVMLEDVPSHLHVDAEMYYGSNPGLTLGGGNEICARFVDSVAKFLTRYERADGRACADSPEDVTVTITNGCTDTKWSAHLTFWIKGGTAMFANNYHCGEVMRAFLDECTRSRDRDFLFFFPEKNIRGEKTEFFADMAIYTKNRCLRPPYCSKMKPGKPPWPFVPMRVNCPANSVDALISEREVEETRALYVKPPILMDKESFLHALAQRCPKPKIETVLRCRRPDGSEPASRGLHRTPAFAPVVIPRASAAVYGGPVVERDRESGDQRITNDAGLEFWKDAAAHISTEWKDNAQTLSFGWYDPRWKIVRIASNGRICRVKERSLQGAAEFTDKERMTHKNSIWFELLLRPKKWIQGCWSRNDPCMTKNELTGASYNKVSDEHPLPEILHARIDEFLDRAGTDKEAADALVDGFFESLKFCQAIPLDEKRACG